MYVYIVCTNTYIHHTYIHIYIYVYIYTYIFICMYDIYTNTHIYTIHTDTSQQSQGGLPADEKIKEAMLVIRGSNSVMDWSINLEEEMCDYSYTHIVRRDDVFVSSSQDPLEDSSSTSGGSGSSSGCKKGKYSTSRTYIVGSSTTT